jgi:hypothetical protein
MNLYPTASDPEVPLAPADWTMTMGSVGHGDMVYYYADVSREACADLSYRLLGTSDS